MNIEIWKEKILEVMEEISNEEYQREAWLGNGEKVSSPEELYCNLLDDFIFEDFLKKNAVLSEDQLYLGKKS